MSRRKQTFEADEGLKVVDALDEDHARMPAGEGCRLQDLPMQLFFHRLWETLPEHNPPLRDATALKGWTLEFDAYGFGVKVYVRILMDGNMSVIIEDGDGRTNVAEYERAPLSRSLETGEVQ